MTATYLFEHCRVHVDDDDRRVTTEFAGGATVTAIPVVDAECVARARALGYEGSDEDAVWEMTRWHDLLHTVVAEAAGRPWSPTLHAVAHGDYRLAPGTVEREERIVLFVQRVLAQGIASLLEDRRA